MVDAGGMLIGIHHLGLTVRDVEASAAWYEDVLGFRACWTSTCHLTARAARSSCDTMACRLGWG